MIAVEEVMEVDTVVATVRIVERKVAIIKTTRTEEKAKIVHHQVIQECLPEDDLEWNYYTPEQELAMESKRQEMVELINSCDDREEQEIL
ncbi:17522_t:CDS:2 [Funneliformis geosporum]|nr:17522_t:CDS:2 [Funneliformis geosporum]